MLKSLIQKLGKIVLSKYSHEKLPKCTKNTCIYAYHYVFWTTYKQYIYSYSLTICNCNFTLCVSISVTLTRISALYSPHSYKCMSPPHHHRHHHHRFASLSLSLSFSSSSSSSLIVVIVRYNSAKLFYVHPISNCIFVSRYGCSCRSSLAFRFL